jgi:hypothetical protein
MMTALCIKRLRNNKAAAGTDRFMHYKNFVWYPGKPHDYKITGRKLEIWNNFT